MRIGYLIPGWPPDKVPNGIAATLGRLGDALEQLGHEVYFITSSIADGVHDSRVSIMRPTATSTVMDKLRWRFDFDRTLYNKTASSIRDHLRLLISEKGIDIFQMEETHGWANKVATDLSIPVVTRLHGPWFTYAGINFPDVPSRRDKKRIETEGMAIRSAFALTAPSNAVLQSTRDYYGSMTELRKVIPNPMPLSSAESAWKFQTCNKSNLLFVGRFDEHKGGDVVLQAFFEMAKSRPDLRLTFVGPDSGIRTGDGNIIHFHDYVRGKVSTEMISRINYLGTRPRSEIDGLRKVAALTIVASRYENFPNTVSEAIAIGAPIVATSVGGIPELLDNEKSAILVEPGNSGALACACLRLLDNPNLAIKLAGQARKDCSTRYLPEKIARKTVQFYSEVIEKFSQRKFSS